MARLATTKHKITVDTEPLVSRFDFTNPKEVVSGIMLVIGIVFDQRSAKEVNFIQVTK